jgi:hypothetical protein
MLCEYFFWPFRAYQQFRLQHAEVDGVRDGLQVPLDEVAALPGQKTVTRTEGELKPGSNIMITILWFFSTRIFAIFSKTEDAWLEFSLAKL